MNIIYFGKPYSFSHVAALKRFKKNNIYLSKDNSYDVIETVFTEPDSIGIVPIENTTAGIIFDTVDVLIMQKYLESNLSILEELELHIKLFLLSKKDIPLNKIKTVYSHEVVIKRAEPWIKQHLSENVEIKPAVSTSEAIGKIENNKYACAIASSEAAAYYGLIKLQEINVMGKRNLTRFFVIGKNENSNKENKQYRTTIVFSLKDKIGVLCDALLSFKKNKINLTRIVSIPDRNKEWQYIFFMEIEGTQKDTRVIKALNELKKHSIYVYILGSYPFTIV